MADIAAIEARLRLLEDKEAIRAVLNGIARGTDRYDPALLGTHILPEAELDMGGAAAMRGSDFAAALSPPPATRPGRMHILANPQITVEGDSARSESYVVSVQDVMVEGVRKTRIRAGRYLDRFARQSGAWRLAARTLIDEWSRVDLVGETVTPGRHTGRPAPDDLSCA